MAGDNGVFSSWQMESLIINRQFQDISCLEVRFAILDAFCFLYNPKTAAGFSSLVLDFSTSSSTR